MEVGGKMNNQYGGVGATIFSSASANATLTVAQVKKKK
jgi:hypothetical protein